MFCFFFFVSSILIFQCRAHLLKQSVALKEANLDHPPPFFGSKFDRDINGGTSQRLVSCFFCFFFYFKIQNSERERERETINCYSPLPGRDRIHRARAKDFAMTAAGAAAVTHYLFSFVVFLFLFCVNVEHNLMLLLWFCLLFSPQTC